MRTFLIIFITIVVIGGAFALYVSFQDPVAKRPPKSMATSSARPRLAGPTTSASQSVHGIGSGDNPWVKRFEKGELASMFRSARWEPKGGDLVAVTTPEAEFFSGNGEQRLRVEGVSGEVIVPGGGQAQASRTPAAGGGKFTPPSRGLLQTVKISMYEPADAAEPSLVATMPNAVFDNDTFRIATDAYTDANGQRIEADQVPVVVDGRDYAFRGRGLVIRWNQLDRKLQLLEVAHGESLTVKNLDALSTKPKLTPAPAATPTSVPTARAATSVMNAMLASADPRAVVLAAAAADTSAAAPAPAGSAAKKPVKKRPAPSPPPAPAAVPATRPKLVRDLSPVVYRATFDDDVNIFEADKPVATATRLEIDIMQEQQEDPATKPSAGDSATADPTSRPTRRRRADATSAPATGPAGMQGPITVKWTGKLRVVPLEGEHDAALVPGKALVRLTGAPVVITHEDMRAQSGIVAFNSANGTASLQANDIVPMVTMTLADGANIATPSLTYVEQPDGKHLATLIGESRAVMTSKGAKDPLTLTWSKDGRIQLVDLPSGKSTIEQADFSGSVKVVHPDLDMTGQTLSLAFDPPQAMKAAATPQPADVATTTPQTAGASSPSPSGNDAVADSIREINATGDVKCRMRDGGDATGEPRNIDTQNLKVRFDVSPTGQRYAHYINADGGVRTMQGGDEMQAGHLEAELAPAPAPATTQPIATVDASDAKPVSALGGSGGGAKLVSLVAKSAVKLKTADGSTANAGTLTVETVNGHEQYHLLGDPVATVTQDKTVISGPSIRLAPDEQLAEVVGVGGMKGTLPDDPKESFDIAWAGGAVVNGATNLIDVTKQVVIKSVQEDGTVNTATSGHLQAHLAPKPTTAPVAIASVAPQAATTTAAESTRPLQADKMNFLAGKEITSATLTADAPSRVEIKSELNAPSGALLRGLNLWASTVTTNRATGRLEVPVPGEMLLRDHRPPDQKNAAAAGAAGAAGAGAPAAKEGPTVGSGRGNTAFKWSKSLVYDDAQKQAVMTGDVEVIHQPITREGQPFNLFADQLTAVMEADPAAVAAAAAAKTEKAAEKTPKMRLKRVLATGHAKVESERLNVVDTSELSYDPVAQVLHARSTEGVPITIVDKEKGTTSTAGELEWNTATDQFRVKDLSGKVRP